MRPCDCKSIYDAHTYLKEQGIAFNDAQITVVPGSVILSMGHTEIKIPMRSFKRFSEWYLEDQGCEEGDHKW